MEYRCLFRKEKWFSFLAISVRFVPDVLNALLTAKVARFLFIRMSLYWKNYVKVKKHHQVAQNYFLGVTVEHRLAHIGQWQGERARYLGIRKNLFDLRRMAVVHNLHVMATDVSNNSRENCMNFKTWLTRTRF